MRKDSMRGESPKRCSLKRDTSIRSPLQKDSPIRNSLIRNSLKRDSLKRDSTSCPDSPQGSSTVKDSSIGCLHSVSNSSKRDSLAFYQESGRRDSPRSLKSQDSGYEGGLRSLEDSDSGESHPGRSIFYFVKFWGKKPTVKLKSIIYPKHTNLKTCFSPQ